MFLATIGHVTAAGITTIAVNGLPVRDWGPAVTAAVDLAARASTETATVGIEAELADQTS